MVGDRRMKLRARRHAVEVAELQWHHRDHALREIADRRLHDRVAGQLRISPELRHMFVLQRQAIGQEFGRILALADIVLDHRAAAAGIAGNAVDGDRKIGGQQAGGDQRTNRRDRALRPAAGIGDVLRVGDLLRLILVHFCKAIFPALGHAMRGRGVNDLCRVVLDQRHALLGRGIRQAEDRDIGGVEEFGPGRGFLAALGGNGDDLQVAAVGQQRPDLQACRAMLAVNEDFRFHRLPNSLRFQDYMPLALCRTA